MTWQTPNGDPFDPLTVVLSESDALYRVHSQRFRSVQFNPGFGYRSRFAFFDDGGRTVPVLYAASTPEAAVCETILHDLPAAEAKLRPSAFRDRVMSRICPARTLRLASFTSEGLRRLRTTPSEVTSAPPDRYGETVRWAETVYQAGLDGIVWISDRHNESYAYVVFDRPDRGSTFSQDPTFAKAFGVNSADADWLVRFCDKLGIAVVG